MSFLSVKFLILMMILVIALHFARAKCLEKSLIILAGFLFYASFDVKGLLLLIPLCVFTWGMGKIIAAKADGGKTKGSEKDNVKDNPAKPVLIFGISVQILVLLFFKYAGFIKMPVGLSFYMLQAISYLYDMYRGKIEKDTSFSDALLYVSFFPNIISGPIMKAHEFLPQTDDRIPLTTERLGYGLQLILIGAFEKLVMADRLSVAVNSVYAAPMAYSGLSLLFTAVGYSLQLLFDFAGYSTMAIGIAHILGFRLTENFNLPYIALNPSEFWKRWHISLSSWLKEYVYIPLGGNRKGKVRTYINIFLTMLVSGLWHGNTVNFVIWGGLHGAGQIVHRFFKEMKDDSGSLKTESTDCKRRPQNLLPSILSAVINFVFVTILWIPFRLDSLSDAWLVISRIFTMKSGISYYYVYTWIFLVMLIIIEIFAIIRTNGNDPIKPLPLTRFHERLIFMILLIATLMFAYFGNSAFIYAGF
ncbi:MAG: hypothetical protein K6G22_02110 [Lachnospiraceae bacterium]|nr:hypothetical protein [Lachnospiraceae bacterium]